jgi:hypothetical protein
VAKPLSQRLKEGLEWLRQGIKSHPLVFTVIIGPIVASLVVSLFLLYLGDPWKTPDVTVNASDLAPYYGLDVEGPAIYSDVSVYNAGDATAENCYVTVTDIQTKKVEGKSNQINVPPAQERTERIIMSIPKLPKGHRYTRTYRIRAECSNDDSTGILRAINLIWKY